MADNKRGLFGFVNNAMDRTVGQVVPKSPEEVNLLVQKRKQDQEEAARILLEKQQPAVMVANPQLAQAESQMASQEAAAAQAQAKLLEQEELKKNRPKVDDQGRIQQTTVGGKVMDAIFGSWFN